MRAIRARYNPYLQTKDRVEQLKRLGHDTDKVEFIIMGGTFMSLDQKYRDYSSEICMMLSQDIVPILW